MKSAYGKSGHSAAAQYTNWSTFNTAPYISGTHGNRYVNNYANPVAEGPYGKYEDVGSIPAGGVLAKDSFGVNGKGQVGVGPLFLMEKMEAGFNPPTGDWKYVMIMPNGSVFGETKGKNASGVQFCADCHGAVGATQDHLFFLPPDLRK